MKRLLTLLTLTFTLSGFSSETVYIQEGEQVVIEHTGCKQGEYPSITYNNNTATASCQRALCLIEIYADGNTNRYGGYVYVPTSGKNYGLVHDKLSRGRKIKRIASYNVFSSSTQLFNSKEAKQNLLKRFVDSHRECRKGITMLNRFGYPTLLEYTK
jgi:hypothetical protein